jgi:hypothetical protein
MHAFIKRFADGVFYPEEVEILIAAFDDAWAKLQASRARFAEEAYASAAQEILAKQIIMAAKRGERNTRHLSQDALLTAEIESKAARGIEFNACAAGLPVTLATIKARRTTSQSEIGDSDRRAPRTMLRKASAPSEL